MAASEITTAGSVALQQALDEVRATLERLEAQEAIARAQIEHLETTLAAQQQDAQVPRDPMLRVPLPLLDGTNEARGRSAAAKVALFRSLFRGREDIFPRRWANAKTGRSGYAPACANEWVRGVCEKPRIKCGECPNRRFISVDDHVITDHLTGRHVLGVYPLSTDDTCWFLAADFDGEMWREDVVAFRDSAHMAQVPLSIERSRSGDGAHAWIFFDAPVPAMLARQIGCMLLTDTMRRRHQMPMRSYDRLFPNQDTLPKGGFGNLIALPLQGEARRHGNTVFLDDTLEPFRDQWAYLQTIARLSRARAETLAAEAAHARRLIVVRAPWEVESESIDHPCQLLGIALTDPVPAEVPAVLAHRLSVAKAGLPSSVLREIKNVAAFQNPEFYKRLRLRLYMGETPRVIDCAEELPEHVAVPRGCLDEVETLLREYGAVLRIEDRRERGHFPETCTTLSFSGTLRPEQHAAVEAIFSHDIGVLVAPPGTGKTVIGAALIARRNTSTLVLVHSMPIAEQWVAQLGAFLGVTPGMHGAGKSRRTGVVDVAMLPSVVRHGDVKGWVAEYGHVVVDECHHVPAVSFERVLASVRARYLIGLTATPQRRDGWHPILHMQLGLVRHTISAAAETERRQLVPRLIVRHTAFTLPAQPSDTPIQTLYGLLAIDATRNDLIFDDVLHALEEGRSPIVLTERTEHLEYLAARLGKFTPNLVVLRGGESRKTQQTTLARLATIPAGEERLIIATGRYVGEGFDDPRLDTLFLTMPISWKGRLVQYAGRLHRTQVGKREVRIYDYVDGCVPMLAQMFKRRMHGYRSMGYTSA